MKLYEANITPSSRKVRMFLHEKGLQVSTVEVTDNFQLAQWYTEKYPHRIAPMLELDSGEQLGEALAICRYLDELHPTPPLFGRDPLERAKVDMWERRANNEGMAAVEEVFRNSHPGMVNRGVPGTSQPVPQIPALVERGRGRLHRFFTKFDHQLAASKFLVRDYFSVADITMLCAIDFARWRQMDIPEDCKNLKRWYGDMCARPSAAA
jgi:glutathione S-transferase